MEFYKKDVQPFVIDITKIVDFLKFRYGHQLFRFFAHPLYSAILVYLCLSLSVTDITAIMDEIQSFSHVISSNQITC